jgi:hypothetical protein
MSYEKYIECIGCEGHNCENCPIEEIYYRGH